MKCEGCDKDTTVSMIKLPMTILGKEIIHTCGLCAECSSAIERYNNKQKELRDRVIEITLRSWIKSGKVIK